MTVDAIEIPSGRPGTAEEIPAEQKDQPILRPKKKSRSRIAQILSVLGLAIVLLAAWRFFAGKTEKAATPNRAPAVPVEIGIATQKDVPILVKGIGNVEALSTVSVRSQITGNMLSVLFTPGQEVNKNDLLFKIDPRPFQAALNEAQSNFDKAEAAVKQGQATVAKDQAIAANARALAKRQSELVETGVIARQDYDNSVSAAVADEATVRADEESVNNLIAALKAQQAVVENAKVQISYTDIRATISGKTGNLTVTAGNMVQPSETTPLVTITQTAPIYVTFSVPQQQLDEIRKRQGAAGFSVQSFAPGDDTHAAFGRLSLVDNTVDTTTGTIRLKATFENTDRRMYPGQFVNVVLTLGIQQGAVVVPSQAVQIGQDQSFVYVVKPDMTVEVRKIKTGTSVDNLTVVEEGLKAGEQVVIDGQLSLVPGAKVQSRSDANGGGGGQGGRGGRSGGGGQYGAGPQSNGGSQSGSGGQAGAGGQSGAGPQSGGSGQSGAGQSGSAGQSGGAGQGGQGGTAGGNR
jgi:multidrug efflux system membrane fusion protein